MAKYLKCQYLYQKCYCMEKNFKKIRKKVFLYILSILNYKNTLDMEEIVPISTKYSVLHKLLLSIINYPDCVTCRQAAKMRYFTMNKNE